MRSLEIGGALRRHSPYSVMRNADSTGNFALIEASLRKAQNRLMTPAYRVPCYVGPTAAMMLSPCVDSLIETWQYLGVDRAR
jgi:hypothetical protein